MSEQKQRGIAKITEDEWVAFDESGWLEETYPSAESAAQAAGMMPSEPDDTTDAGWTPVIWFVATIVALAISIVNPRIDGLDLLAWAITLGFLISMRFGVGDE